MTCQSCSHRLDVTLWGCWLATGCRLGLVMRCQCDKRALDADLNILQLNDNLKDKKMNDATLQFIRADYLRVLAETGMSHKQVVAMSENTHDLVDLPPGFKHLRLAPSPIGGQGLFTDRAIEEGAVIGPARIDGKRTLLGRYANNSPWQNAAFRPTANGDAESVALCAIPAGGEIVNDYRQGAGLWGARFNSEETNRTMRERHELLCRLLAGQSGATTE